MILILSQNKSEATTENIIDWLDYFEYPFKRLNGVDFYKKTRISISKKETEIKFADFEFDEIQLVWFRRWLSYENKRDLFLPNKSKDHVIYNLNRYVNKELKCLLEYFFSIWPVEKKFSAMHIDEINKLMVLKKAVELKIEIPETYVFTKTKDFENLKSKGVELITKSVGNGLSVFINDSTFLAYTELVKKLPGPIEQSFAPSLFQEHIIKKYEIRSFYLNESFYSMAIFSQKDSQTKVDFRKYNHDYPNRVTPIKLPKTLENKLCKLAKHFGLSTGSFDLIKTMDNKYVLLEVNPGGQFEMVSYPCNYNLEQKMALALIKEAKKNEIRTNIN